MSFVLWEIVKFVISHAERFYPEMFMEMYIKLLHPLFLYFFLSAWILTMLSNSGSVRPGVSSNLCLYVYIFNLCLIYGEMEVLYIGAAGSSVCDCVPVRGWTLGL